MLSDFAQLFGIWLGNVLAYNLDAPLGDWQQADGGATYRSLAGTRLTDQADNLTREDVKTKVRNRTECWCAAILWVFNCHVLKL